MQHLQETLGQAEAVLEVKDRDLESLISRMEEREVQ